MTPGIPLLALAIAFVLATGAGAQAIPDFSGTWRLEETRSESRTRGVDDLVYNRDMVVYGRQK